MSEEEYLAANNGKHGRARQLAEAALRAEREGDSEKAEALFAEAERTDPMAVINLLQEREDQPGALSRDATDDPSDEEVARLTNQIEPQSDAPSRANVTGPGSGGDAQ